ncbi:hypothetical protein HELRODRAFT_90115 [Helobdella robusta]|uniref:Ribosome biogenesis protein BOP1 homolog n=1 Tax=Helobdella robusta TaxID=6412 RepID=T1G7L2_HELRO|nr:hypothetical protein HELRODRAFT_90115 [Helobdella robusta]ESN91959.1 hypothetical protein HELRODRAFT_90115 [Helobdella robusta]
MLPLQQQHRHHSNHVTHTQTSQDVRNTIGDVPIEWYNEYDHCGYDLDGKKITKDVDAAGDELDDFIQKMDNVDYWRTVRDKSTGKKVVLSDDDVRLIRKFLRGKYASKETDPYPAFDEPFVRETMIHPVTNHIDEKRSFEPSRWERLKVGQLVHSIKMGWLKISEEKEKEPKFYELWTPNPESEKKNKIRQYVPAPKMPLPGHAESYNPPPEYLFTPEEEKKWRESEESERRINFIPRKFRSLREVTGYARFVNERFERCLDLYLCPRQIKMKAKVKAEDLLPKLPSPRDLQPFPTIQSLIYKGHTDAVRSISTDPTGLWLASGSEDCTLKIWEISTGRCVKEVRFESKVGHVAWNPRSSLSIVAVSVNTKVYIINTMLGSQVQSTDSYLRSYQAEKTVDPGSSVTEDSGSDNDDVELLCINHPNTVNQISWQSKGDYFAVVLKEGQSMSVLLHRLSTKVTMNPFSKPKGLVQCVSFHPTKPMLFVATQQFIRVYDLVKQMLTKKLMSNCKWISSMAIHPWGDNMIVGSYDSRLAWFDMELSEKPYQTLKHHKSAIRQVTYHKSLPLFASCSDDGSTIVCHGRVFNDFTINPLIVPVKILRGHVMTRNLGVLDCTFHPTEPWLFSAGADHTIRLYS